MEWQNEITKQLGLDYPIIQAPMFGVGTIEMVAATAGMGGLGSLPLGDLPPDKCVELIHATRKLTNKKFAVNIFVNDIPPLSKEMESQYDNSRRFIEQLALEHGIEVKLPDIQNIKLTDYREQIDALISEQCPIVSFTFGNLDKDSIERLKKNGIKLIGTCTSVKEALILEQSGIDIICVQGLEAGGHRGSFEADNITHIGGLSLLPQVYDAVSLPIIYGGGINSPRSLYAAHVLGAQGFQIGSMLLCSAESALLDFEKKALKDAQEDQIVLTKSFSGRYAKGISNAFIKALDNTPYILPYPYQNKLTGELRKQAKKLGNIDFVSVWAGNSLSSFSDASTTAILSRLVKETTTAFGNLNQNI
jgi:nitronate monooxygenase